VTALSRATEYEIRAAVRIRLYVIAAQQLTADSLAVALGQQPDFEVVGTQTGSAMGEERVRRADPDIVILSASQEAARLTAALSGMCRAATLIVASAEDPALLADCVTAGAVGFLIRPALSDLADAIRRAVAGWSIFTAEQVAALVARARPGSPDRRAVERCATLSAREREILRVLATGATAAEVAARLAISVETVRTHTKNALRSVGATSKLEAIFLALQAGIIEEADLFR
jgi:DNA-binding NarL/FixJ family response regulator